MSWLPISLVVLVSLGASLLIYYRYGSPDPRYVKGTYWMHYRTHIVYRLLGYSWGGTWVELREVHSRHKIQIQRNQFENEYIFL